MSELNIGSRRHTGQNIKLFVLAVLQKYDFKIEQIYSITQDNGRNFILAGKMLTYDQFELRHEKEERQEESSVDEDDDMSSNDELEVNSPEEQAQNDMDDANCVEWVEEDDDLEFVDEEDNYNIIEEEEADLNEVTGVEVIKCAAHTLALGMNDTVEKINMKKTFLKFRKMAKFLKTPNQVTNLRLKKLSLPKVDNVTRWNSSWDLMHSMENLKLHCSTANFKKEATAAKVRNLTVADWKFSQRFLRVFKPAKICTKQLQGEQVTMSDFFKMWNDLMLRTKKLSLSDRMAAELYKNLSKREEMLFIENKPLQAALYLDPRFRLIFTKMRTNYFNETVAQQHLFQLYKHLKTMERSEDISDRNEPATSQPATSVENSEDDDNILECYIKELYAEINENDLHVDEDSSVAFDIICNFKDKKPLQTNVLQYWYDNRFQHPLLYKLSTIVFAVPASQVSVERSFSILKFILSDYRTRLDPDLLQDIMLVRLN